MRDTASGPMMKTCLVCAALHANDKYCSRTCYLSVPVAATARAKMSAASLGKSKSEQHRKNIAAGTRGKPKPWNRGKGNPNHGNCAQGQPEAHARFLAAVKERGQPWTDEHRRQHAATMRGPSNTMRGRSHTLEAKAAMSAAKKRQYREGAAGIRRYKLSAAEREIGALLASYGTEVRTQFHIRGIPFFYDLFLPAFNLLIEYQGDYWHANPSVYAAGTILPIRHERVAVEDMWARDEAKRRAGIGAGYRVAHVWERDYKRRGMIAVWEACLAAADQTEPGTK